MSGKMGRPKTPTAQLKIHGTFRRDRRYDDEPMPEVGIPERPKFLKGPARKEWDRITPILLEMRCITDADMAMIAAYCFEWGLYATLAKKVKYVDLIVTTINGNEILNPLYNARNRALKNFKELASEFGLSPSSRTRIKATTEPGKQNPFAALMGGNAAG